MAERVGQQLGNYQLVRFLGSGGFAQVYLGEHVRLGTQAAIKILHTQLASQEVENFQSEARTVAHLDHPHIVRVLDFDVSQGTPFLVMTYAPNGTLRQRHTKNTPLPLPSIISYVKQLADALQYAHDERVIHRDIKPENMLIGRRNEILLSDFGIALIAQSSHHQSTLDMVGTVTYMAPEQIQGKPRPASDQYALGVVVYEWLCGRRPFHGSFTEIATQHVLAPPPPLREQMPTLSPALEQVVMIALAKDPHDRFATIRAFATALEQATVEDKNPSHSLYTASPALPIDTPPGTYNSPTALVLPRSNQASGSLATPVEESTLASLSVPSAGALICAYQRHSAPVSSIAWSPDGTQVASASDDGTVQVWSATSGQRHLKYTGHAEEVAAVAWSPDGNYLASAGMDQAVHVWEPLRGQRQLVYHGHKGSIWSLAWSPEGDCIASASDDQTVQVWDTQTGTVVFTCSGASDSVWAVAWSPSDTYLAFQNSMSQIQMCDPIDGRKFRVYRGHTQRVWSIACSPDGSLIASGAEDRTVHIWSATNGQRRVLYQGHTDNVIAVAWSPDGAYVASGGDDQVVKVWVASTGKEVCTYDGHSGGILALAWSPDGTCIASASDDQTVHVWVAP